MIKKGRSTWWCSLKSQWPLYPGLCDCKFALIDASTQSCSTVSQLMFSLTHETLLGHSSLSVGFLLLICEKHETLQCHQLLSTSDKGNNYMHAVKSVALPCFLFLRRYSLMLPSKYIHIFLWSLSLLLFQLSASIIESSLFYLMLLLDCQRFRQ